MDFNQLLVALLAGLVGAAHPLLGDGFHMPANERWIRRVGAAVVKMGVAQDLVIVSITNPVLVEEIMLAVSDGPPGHGFIDGYFPFSFSHCTPAAVGSCCLTRRMRVLVPFSSRFFAALSSA
ncbi:hypothetical protein LJJ44_23830 [Pseudomonas sp. B24_DOA]|nr:hypothetical protein LJJ44_23830 [Pseudomonas sp. B24_DOA]WKV89607.1 hypothetical protein LJU32_04290 [Pseudomonas sp. B21_DOA]